MLGWINCRISRFVIWIWLLSNFGYCECLATKEESIMFYTFVRFWWWCLKNDLLSSEVLNDGKEFWAEEAFVTKFHAHCMIVLSLDLLLLFMQLWGEDLANWFCLIETNEYINPPPQRGFMGSLGPGLLSNALVCSFFVFFIVLIQLLQFYRLISCVDRLYLYANCALVRNF